MLLRRSWTFPYQTVSPNAGPGVPDEMQGRSLGAKRKGPFRADKRERISQINSLRISRQACMHCLGECRDAERATATPGAARRHVVHYGT